MIFGVYADSEEYLKHVEILDKSLRTFCGKYRDSDICLFIPAENYEQLSQTPLLSDNSRIRSHPLTIDPCSQEFYYSGKVFAAALAEQIAEQDDQILVWLDSDTIFLGRPDEFDLAENICFGYRPVMHNLMSSLYHEPPTDFWKRVYELLGVQDEAFFPMLTHTDRQEIRPYFNCGVIAVRAQRGILRKWLECWQNLYTDPVFIEQAKEEKLVKIFLHQAALVGAVLNLAGKDEMIRLSDKINYPLFFKEMFGAEHEYNDLTNVTTLRYDIYFRNPAPDWVSRLSGPENILNWLSTHLG